MIRNIAGSSLSKRVCSLAIKTQLPRVQHRQYSVLHDHSAPVISKFISKIRLNIRTMSSDSSRNLAYDDILKLPSQKDVVLIDVREPDEIKETGLIPGFIHIPLGDVPAALSLSDESFKQKYGIDKPGQDVSLVFSCRSGMRSQKALTKALELGYSKSKHYAGGWLDWESNVKK